MEIKAIDHITVNVKDLEKTKYFYGELLGLSPLPVVTIPGVQKVYYYALPGGVRLELIDYEERLPVSRQSEMAPGSCRHFAFETEDIRKLEKKFNEAGYYFHYPIQYSDDFKCTHGLIFDPNGFELEFVQY